MPSVADELAALRSQGLTKKNASNLKHAKGLSTPEKEENAIKSEQERLRVGSYGKAAESNLQSFNEAKIAVSSPKKSSSAESTTTQSQPVAAAVVDEKAGKSTTNLKSNAATAGNDDDVPELEEIDDVPTLEEVPELDEIPSMDNVNSAAVAAEQPREINRAERKARRMMEKINMRKVPGITQCIIKMKSSGPRANVFTIAAPDCYINSTNSAYIIFGEARQGGPINGGAAGGSTGAQQQEAIQQLAALSNQQKGGTAGIAADGEADASVKIEEINDSDKPNEDEDEIDTSGIDPKDIELVISQAGCSKSKAVNALKENDGDLVNAIMSLTT